MAAERRARNEVCQEATFVGHQRNKKGMTSDDKRREKERATPARPRTKHTHAVKKS